MMKKITLSILTLSGFFATLQAQNVGIGTLIPTGPLTVMANDTAKGITQKKGMVEVGFYTSSSVAYIQTWSAHDLNFSTNNGSSKITVANASGFVGINASTPTAQMDINGTLRIRSNGAAAGKVLTSDALGNATWQLPTRSDVYSVNSSDFKSANGTNTVYLGGGGAYYNESIYGNLLAPVHLPDGAKVTNITVWYNDNSASENITFNFYGETTFDSNPVGYTNFATLNSSGAANNTFRTVTQSFATPIVIDNESYNYQFTAFVHWPGNSNIFAVKSVKFTYTY